MFVPPMAAAAVDARAAANFEEDADSSLGQTNDDLALMRFEFLEALTRVALLKFGKEQGVSDVSDSVRMLLEAMQPKLPQLVKQDSNVFRVRLYSQVTDSHLSLVLAARVAAARRQGRWAARCVCMCGVGSDGGVTGVVVVVAGVAVSKAAMVPTAASLDS